MAFFPGGKAIGAFQTKVSIMIRLLDMLTVAHARGNTLEFTIPARRAQSFMGRAFTSSSTAQEMGRFVICENRYELSSRYKIGLAHKTEPMSRWR